MNPDKCASCGDPTIYEEELGSAVCTSCGTLTNPSQSVLASHLEHVDTSGYERTPYANPSQGSTLKGRNGWALAGQDKDARDRRNTVSMHQFIRTLAGRLSCSSSVSRAQAVFDQAMAQGSFRWGRRAKLLAGASLAIALREANKSDSLRDIAYLLEESLPSLSKAFTTTIDLLQLRLGSADPAQHMPTLQIHLLSIIKEPSSVPPQLHSLLSPLEQSMPTIQRTATSLSHVVSRVPSLACLPSASTACAILMLSLEGEVAASLPHAGSLAQALGIRVGASKATVMQRYKTVYDLVEEYIQDVPWLESHERKGKGRSKVAKRVIVARGLKDVVQFQEEIWRQKLESQERLVLDIEIESADGDDTSSVATSEHSDDDSTPQPKKARKSAHDRAIERTSQFLLQPLAKRPTPPATTSTSQQDGQRLLEHFFTADESSLAHAFVQPPTRLQVLASSRGEGMIDDEDLFEDGEMEALMRTSDEVEVLRKSIAQDWDIPPDSSPGSGARPKKRKHQDSAHPPSSPPAKRTKRVNMDALARLLDPETHLDEVEADEEGKFDAFSNSWSLDLNDDDDHSNGGHTPFATTHAGDDEEIEEWRPLSPGGGGFDEDRYDA
ncbi:hypothetical protein PHLGIDRAFT_180745 [Phlebiopsis gigantea 11061_1 CR5-6]|uniref:TFIIB-type domain-containing protein n=1 Tax=Phlebiopsis gigantea (strain 11061_1 CR5-6) TaxID=745531 RepID=A0A0C3PGF6_PHLG1|nr:hypothetical protein PHLGIDRAFT_180745 [Phlebiopsis gigantea 11061_1 CR5-6]